MILRLLLGLLACSLYVRLSFVPMNWHDYTRIFPLKIEGRWYWRVQRRQRFTGSGSETCISWNEWRVRGTSR